MQDTKSDIKLSIDMKKNRIRFHKSMLHLLHDPPYIQLLINPDTMLVAVRALSKASPGDQSHRVPKKSLLSDNSVEIYSMSLVSRIADTLGIDDMASTYRLEGKLLPNESAAVFDLHTVIQVKEPMDERIEDR